MINCFFIVWYQNTVMNSINAIIFSNYILRSLPIPSVTSRISGGYPPYVYKIPGPNPWSCIIIRQNAGGNLCLSICKVVAPWLGIIAQNRELQDGPRILGSWFLFSLVIINLVLIFKWSMIKISATTFLFPLWFLHIITHPKIMKDMTLLSEFRLDRFLDESVVIRDRSQLFASC